MHAVANSSLHLASGGVFFAPHRGPHASGAAEEIPTSRAKKAPTSSSCLPPRPWDSGPRLRNPALVTKNPHLNAWEYPATEAQPT